MCLITGSEMGYIIAFLIAPALLALVLYAAAREVDERRRRGGIYRSDAVALCVGG